MRPVVVGLVAVAAGCGARRAPVTDSIAVVCRGHALRAELAMDVETQSRGLMFRKTLERDGGMLFVNPRDVPMGLWMKDTYLPLSAAFLDGEGRVVNVVDMDPFDETTHRSEGPVKYALEANRGWFSEHGIGPGDVCSIEMPQQ